MIWANIHQDSCFCERGCETAACLLRKAQEIADLLEANSSSSSSPLLAPSCQHPKCVGSTHTRSLWVYGKGGGGYGREKGGFKSGDGMVVGSPTTSKEVGVKSSFSWLGSVQKEGPASSADALPSQGL